MRCPCCTPSRAQLGASILSHLGCLLPCLDLVPFPHLAPTFSPLSKTQSQSSAAVTQSGSAESKGRGAGA